MRTGRGCAAILALAACAAAADINELDLNNFDDAIRGHQDVLVHFYAPWSVRCKTFGPVLDQLARSSEYGDKLYHGRSDIADERGYTSYLDQFGVLKLPTLVLFRNGHPHPYGLDEPIDSYEAVVGFLEKELQSELRPRYEHPEDLFEMPGGPSAQYAQLEAHHRKLREKQLASEAAEAAAELKRGEAIDADRLEAIDRSNEAKGLGRKEAIKLDSLPKTLGDAPPAEEAREPAEGAADGAAADGAAADDACAALSKSVAVRDSDFEKVVMDKTVDVFVLFYRPGAEFCATNGTAYGGLARYASAMSEIVVASMDTSQHKSPFVFEVDELPVVMLFPAADKRPLEYDEKMTTPKLTAFAHEHCPSLKGIEVPKDGKAEL